MIVGIGVDLVDLNRFESKLQETPALIQRIFTPTERER
jgi:holo-[acyl-carrier protein] synthase